MLLSLVVHTYSLRYWFPAAVMLGTAPAYLLSWGAWRLLSTVLPSRLYHSMDDRIYSVYQSMVLFFFENYTGVEVSVVVEMIMIVVEMKKALSIQVYEIVDCVGAKSSQHQFPSLQNDAHG